MFRRSASYSHVTHRDDVLGALFRGRSLPGVIGATEALFGLVMMGFFSLIVIVTGALIGVLNAWLYGYPRLEVPSLVLASLLWLPVAWLEWRSLAFFFDGLPGATDPVPVHVATRLKPHGPLARVLIAAWWVAHAAAIVAVAEAFIYHLRPFNPSTVERVFYVVIPLAILFGTAFAMNTHLLIAVYSLTGSERLVRRSYHFRIVLDLAIVFGTAKLRLALAGGT
jgi:hypothetical protein